MQEAIAALARHLVEVPGRLAQLTTEQLLHKEGPGRWSKQEILGHLADSALHNLWRFQQLSFVDAPFVVISYPQDELVRVNGYQQQELAQVLALWQSMNRQILICWRGFPEMRWQHKVQVPDGTWQTALWLIQDYIHHLEHHLRQMFGSLEQPIWSRSGYEIDANPNRLQTEVVASFIAQSYWAHTRPVETTRRSLRFSRCFGLYQGKTQVGMGRVISDYATYAYLADVFIDETHRGKGLGKWLVECMLNAAEFEPVKRWVLRTEDAHELYSRFGFKRIETPETWMERG